MGLTKPRGYAIIKTVMAISYHLKTKLRQKGGAPGPRS